MGMATFKGKHNQLKSKVLMLLYQEQEHWYSARVMHEILGCDLHSLRTHLKRWHDWRRVKRRHNGFEFEYSIGVKGREWFERWQYDMPIDEYLAEIRAWQAVENSY